MRKMPRLRASHNGSESSAGSTDPKGKHEQDILAKGLATALNSPCVPCPSCWGRDKELSDLSEDNCEHRKASSFLGHVYDIRPSWHGHKWLHDLWCNSSCCKFHAGCLQHMLGPFATLACKRVVGPLGPIAPANCCRKWHPRKSFSRLSPTPLLNKNKIEIVEALHSSSYLRPWLECRIIRLCLVLGSFGTC